MFRHHPNGTSTDFRREFVRRLACHRPYFSRVGVSGKPGAVQLPLRPSLRLWLDRRGILTGNLQWSSRAATSDVIGPVFQTYSKSQIPTQTTLITPGNLPPPLFLNELASKFESVVFVHTPNSDRTEEISACPLIPRMSGIVVSFEKVTPGDVQITIINEATISFD